MQKEYQDALELRLSLHVGYIPELGGASISRRPAILRKEIVARADEFAKKEIFLTPNEWSEIDRMLANMTHVYMRALQDTILHPKLKHEFATGGERQAAEEDARDLQVRSAIELWISLPKEGYVVGSRDKVRPPLTDTYRLLFKRVATAWYKTQKEDLADMCFMALLGASQRIWTKVALEEIRSQIPNLRKERVRRAILILTGAKNHAYASDGEILKTLLVQWFGTREWAHVLPAEQVRFLCQIDELLPHSLLWDRQVLTQAQEQVLSTTSKVARLGAAAALFMNKTRLSIGENWKITSIDPAQMTVHVKHGMQEALHGKVKWGDMEASWTRELEQFALSDGDADIKLVIEIYNLARPEYRTHHFNYTIQGHPARYPALI